MKEAKFPKDGYIFQHKENTEIFARILFLAEGDSIDNYKQITEAEYREILLDQIETNSEL